MPALLRARRRLRPRQPAHARAVKDGDEWVVNGQKIWTSGAQYCDYGILLVRTDPTVAKHKGLSYFVVDMNSPGVEIRPIKQINGGSGFNEVFFTDVRIPDDHRLGDVGNGWRVAIVDAHERAPVDRLRRRGGRGRTCRARPRRGDRRRAGDRGQGRPRADRGLRT